MMRSKAILLAVFLLMTGSVFAQTVPQRMYYKNGKVPVWLDLGVGLNVIHCYDWGVSPQDYLGVGANAKGGVIVEWNRCHVQADARILGNVMFNQVAAQSSAYAGDLRGEFLYEGIDFADEHWHLWYGGGVQGYFDIKMRSQMMNAALGYTSFFNLFGACQIQYDFKPSLNHYHPLFSLYGKLSLPLVGCATRPGFAYLGNGTADPDNALGMLKYYDTFAMAFPGASTDIGFRINLPNSNKIGFSYCWDYLTTRDHGAYRFDHAAHTFNVNFLFNVN